MLALATKWFDTGMCRITASQPTQGLKGKTEVYREAAI
ncbi:hypothetical protein M975_3620 [Buttiauxella brennerae ATCC 51605]|uniref:Uncharacterized protein n=1 Tax=Buttiauxella brennerae ATCC 51605 TaxID=1354251 RepID=A0A1B7IHV2_9ENTR|nr:hypothetical protein M975_3620 [Buttiauxella brennerae ATCC 51605]